MTTPDPPARRATAAYHAAVADGPFDHQRDAYEQGYEDGGAAERERIRRFAATLNSHNPDDSDVLALIREFETAAATAERQKCAQLALAEADRLRGGNLGPLTADVKALFDLADLLGQSQPAGADAQPATRADDQDNDHG